MLKALRSIFVAMVTTVWRDLYKQWKSLFHQLGETNPRVSVSRGNRRLLSVPCGPSLLCSGAYMTQVIHLRDVSLRFEIWDTAGQEKYHSLIPLYYRGAHAALLVYDISKRVRGAELITSSLVWKLKRMQFQEIIFFLYSIWQPM